jgi:hypothetical protein
MAKLSQQINDLNKRVGALESTDFDEAAGVARITKIYGNVRITTKITVRLHTYRKCGDTNPLYPATCAVDSYI